MDIFYAIMATAFFGGVLGFAVKILILDPLEESRSLSRFAQTLRRQRDEARKCGTEFLAPRLFKDTFKD